MSEPLAAELPSLAGLLGQPRALAALRALVESGEPIPPLLLHGPEGVGKRSAALALAAELVCRAEPSQRPCGRCRGCRRVVDADAVTRARASARAGEAPQVYPDVGFVSVPPGRTRISVLQARDLLVSVRTAPYELSHRVYVLEPAERLNDAAANALLKLLEEPPTHAVLVLVSAAPWALPITVRSRLRPLRFGPLDADTLAALLDAAKVEPSEREARLRAAAGSAARALALDPSAEEERVDTWCRLLVRLCAGEDPGALAVAAGESLAGGAEMAREALDTLLAILRDLAAIDAGAAPRLLDEERARALAPHTERLVGEELDAARAIDALAREIVVFNRNARLAVEGAVLALAGLLARGPASRWEVAP